MKVEEAIDVAFHASIGHHLSKFFRAAFLASLRANGFVVVSVCLLNECAGYVQQVDSFGADEMLEKLAAAQGDEK